MKGKPIERKLPYIGCAGVNVPSEWTIEQLKWALENRLTRFTNEAEIIETFERYIKGKEKEKNGTDSMGFN